MAAQVASDKYENARRNLKLVSDEARSTAKEIKSMSDAISKADNRAGSFKKSSVPKAQKMLKKYPFITGWRRYGTNDW